MASSSSVTSAEKEIEQAYLYASNANVSNFVSVKLSGDSNYHLWKTQMLVSWMLMICVAFWITINLQPELFGKNWKGALAHARLLINKRVRTWPAIGAQQQPKSTTADATIGEEAHSSRRGNFRWIRVEAWSNRERGALEECWSAGFEQTGEGPGGVFVFSTLPFRWIRLRGTVFQLFITHQT
ncbi:hypothetical protein E3N88_26548 [Mikania micrantha]|uniref:Retrotransposon Copia-like N-terminal domain-containing protein n=1 Tax=Mikania micrantha TaxID=192012 RepID=A0A5N6MV64_9ASTR|nr:hypothetical protein E3N88_26548 [Mikania micrantha]